MATRHAYLWLGVLTALSGTLSSRTAQADDGSTLSVAEIVQQANCTAYYQGRDGRARVAMTITDAQGRERRRAFTVLRRDHQPEGDAGADPCDRQKFYVFLRRPADVKRTVFAAWKQRDREDDRWLYLPALDVVKRIAASDKRTSFVGSHFFYEDITGRDVFEDDHQLLRTTLNYFVLKSVPKDPATVEFSEYQTWIHRRTFIPVKVEYFDTQGDKYRIYEAFDVETIQGFPTVVRSRMQDLRLGGETELQFSRIEYDVGLPEDVFSERYLRQPPRKYLR